MKIFNTMTRQKEEFVPVHPGKVGIYACGPTVYNYFHIGNARPFVVFDTLRRYLAWRGYGVTFVQNFTDIDDRMITRANQEGITVKELADRFIKEYYTDADALGIKRADVAPKATEHIAEIIELIQELIDKGHAYVSEGDVYFSVPSMESYGGLCGQDLSDLESGARVDVTEKKQDPLDFALWKAEKPGEPAWDSPWGKGRPGWHIECSAMSMKYLGKTFDIHAGGVDLVFPHHENEIAQSESATGQKMVNYWMHNGHINVNNQKMSKSANNFFTVRDISQLYDLMAVRLFLLSAQYRSPINFSSDMIEQATNALSRIRNAVDLLERTSSAQGAKNDAEDELQAQLSGYRDRFIAAMDDDLNTADALGVVFEFVREANTVYANGGSAQGAKKVLAALLELLDVLGIQAVQQSDIPGEIFELANLRAEARTQKNWQEADRLRGEIAARGYVLEDTKQGPVIKKA